VARFRIWLIITFALGAMLATFLRAQTTDEDARKQQFLKTAAKSPTPSPSAKAKKAKSKSSPSPASKAKAKPKPTETPEPDDSPAAKPRKVSETDESTPKPKESASPKSKKKSTSSAKAKTAKKKSTAKKGTASKKKKTAKSGSTGTKKKSQPEETSKAEKTTSSTATPVQRPTAPLPRAIAVPTPLPTIEPIEREPAQLTIEKSGYEKPRGFFSRLFGGGGRSSGGSYRYLTSSIRAEIDRAPVMQRRWQYIVVHNSGTRQGNAAAFDYYHRRVRRMQNGLAYHFVIGNGTSSNNGEVEVGNRWRRQINGGHVHSDYLNNIALGICLVGDFNRDQPTRAQLECSEELIRYLRQRCGKIGNRYAVVRPHREMNPPRWATDCPGDAFPYAWFRRFQD
jgi:hypothetical protein